MSEEEKSSYGQILRSSSLIGFASVITILFGLAKMKTIAVLLGPVGYGLMGLMQVTIVMTATVINLGLPQSSIRQLAAKGKSLRSQAAVRHALLAASIILGLVGTVLIYAFRHQIAQSVFNNIIDARIVALLGLGVFFLLLSNAYSSILQGARKIADIAKSRVLAAAISTVLGIGFLYAMGQTGLVLAVLVTPLCSAVIGWHYSKKTRREFTKRVPVREVQTELSQMAKLGISMMLAAAVVSGVQFGIREILVEQLNLAAVGHFQAAWQISMLYLTLVLQAMTTDYYPRLSAAVSNTEETNRLVQEQTEIALLLAAPLIIFLMGAAPWVVWLLYSSEFSDSVVVLQWQILGDIFKIVSWPMSFVLIAHGKGKTFLAIETMVSGLYLVIIYLGLPTLGLESTGIGFLVMYAVYFPFLYIIIRRETGLRWPPRLWRESILLFTIALSIFLISQKMSLLALVIATFASMFFTVRTIHRLANMNIGGRLGRVLQQATQLLPF